MLLVQIKARRKRTTWNADGTPKAYLLEVWEKGVRTEKWVPARHTDIGAGGLVTLDEWLAVKAGFITPAAVAGAAFGKE